MDTRMAESRLRRGRHLPYDGDRHSPRGCHQPVLANLALDGLEKKLRAFWPKGTHRANQAQVNLVRYADDFIITGSNQELLETRVTPLVVTFMQQRGLILSEEKTTITHIEKASTFSDKTYASTTVRC